jgi:hypothetical protein
MKSATRKLSARPQERLPRNRAERLLWLRKKVEEGYYDSEAVRKATAESLLGVLLDDRRAGKPKRNKWS